MNSLFEDIYGENPSCKKTKVTFRIIGDEINPNEVTRSLNIEPSRAFAKGEEYYTKNGIVHRRPVGHWSLSSEASIGSTSTEEHARYVLSVLEPKIANILQFVKNPLYRTSIVFWWEATDGHGGFALSSDTLSRLCSLCNDVEHHFM